MGGPVYIADPTPEAIRHVQTTLEALRNGQPAYRDNRKYTPYSANPQAAALLQLQPYGWWKADGVLLFRKPEQEDHVSLSAVETAMPDNEALLELPVHTLPTLLAQYGLPSPDILKLDIEGAEYAVLPQILALSPLPRLVCVELHGQDLKQDAGEARGFLSALLEVGYSIGDSDLYGNYTLVRL
jgi:FkbM family methyltransferase